MVLMMKQFSKELEILDFVVNFDKESIEHISTNEGLPSNFIFSLIKANSHIWAATSRGISRIDRNRNIFTQCHLLID